MMWHRMTSELRYEVIILRSTHDSDISVTLKHDLNCTKDDFCKQSKRTFMKMNSLKRNMKGSTGSKSCKQNTGTI